MHKNRRKSPQNGHFRRWCPFFKFYKCVVKWQEGYQLVPLKRIKGAPTHLSFMLFQQYGACMQNGTNAICRYQISTELIEYGWVMSCRIDTWNTSWRLLFSFHNTNQVAVSIFPCFQTVFIKRTYYIYIIYINIFYIYMTENEKIANVILAFLKN